MNELRVGVIGFGWMGRLHSRAWARLAAHYPELPVRPTLVAVGDSNPSEELARSVEAHGFAELHADWRDLLARDDLDVVSVCGPNHLHRDMGVAVAESGRHLWIEKPAGRNAEETAEIVAAVEQAGVQSAAGFNYRNAPAVEHARQLVARRRARQPADRRGPVPRRLLCPPPGGPVVALPQRAGGQWRLGRPGQPCRRPGALRRR